MDDHGHDRSDDHDDGDAHGHDGHGEHDSNDDHHAHRDEFHHDPIAHTEVRAGMTIDELADEYGSAGFGAANIHKAVDIYAEMLGDDVTFFGLAGAMVRPACAASSPTIRDGQSTAVTTGANLTPRRHRRHRWETPSWQG